MSKKCFRDSLGIMYGFFGDSLRILCANQFCLNITELFVRWIIALHVHMHLRGPPWFSTSLNGPARPSMALRAKEIHGCPQLSAAAHGSARPSTALRTLPRPSAHSSPRLSHGLRCTPRHSATLTPQPPRPAAAPSAGLHGTQRLSAVIAHGAPRSPRLSTAFHRRPRTGLRGPPQPPRPRITQGIFDNEPCSRAYSQKKTPSYAQDSSQLRNLRKPAAHKGRRHTLRRNELRIYW